MSKHTLWIDKYGCLYAGTPSGLWDQYRIVEADGQPTDIVDGIGIIEILQELGIEYRKSAVYNEDYDADDEYTDEDEYITVLYVLPHSVQPILEKLNLEFKPWMI